MRYIVHAEGEWKLDKYLAYLRSDGHLLPAGARAFATAEWHYDIRDHRCPHDSWLERLIVRELGRGAREDERSIECEALFKGAFHDGWLELRYEGVRSYDLNRRDVDGPHWARGLAY